ncbi:MAG TPA: response regulator, partial [Bacteroidota bacterium]|nr:response regulator [Bacteroidota bacterium]
ALIEEREEEPPKGHGELILVVDDEAGIREMTRNTLEANGYRAVTACDGAEAIALCVQHEKEIWAVITDMVMPLMDGPATIHALHMLNPELPVIATSGFAGASQMNSLHDAAVRAFLTKPYTGKKLLRALASIAGTTR